MAPLQLRHELSIMLKTQEDLRLNLRKIHITFQGFPVRPWFFISLIYIGLIKIELSLI